MRPFLDKFRVENKSVVAHAAIVEYLRIKHIQLPELRFDFREVDAPLNLIFAGHHHFGHLYLIDTADKRRTANQHLPFIPSVPGKSLSHHIDQIVLCHLHSRIVGIMISGLPPDTARQHHILLFTRVENRVLHTEHKTLFHTQSHIVNSSFLGIREIPFDLFIRYFLESRLLDLHFEYLAKILALDRQSGELCRLHIELRCRTPHTDKRRIHGNRRHAVGHRTYFGTIDGIDGQCPRIFVFCGDIKHQVGIRHLPIGIIPFYPLNQQSFRHLEYAVVHGIDSRLFMRVVNGRCSGSHIRGLHI